MIRLKTAFAAIALACAQAVLAQNPHDLETLTVRATGGATLEPAFAPDRLQYRVALPSDVGALHVRGSAWNGRSAIRVNGQPAASLAWQRMALAPGENRISIAVTPPGGGEPRTYEIVATRDDARPIAERFTRGVHRDAATGLEMPYRLYVPEPLEPGKRYPLVLFLHGGGENGSDNEKQLQGSEGAIVWAKPQEQALRKAYVLAPQARAYFNGDPRQPIGGFGVTRDRAGNRYMTEVLTPSADARMAVAVVEKVMAEHAVDPKRVYATGLSQGGFGTWNVALLRPDLFAAIVPIAGGGDPAQAAAKLRDLPIWGFQAEDDQVVVARYMRETIDALRKAGGSPRYTELPSGTFFDPNEHWSWVYAYRSVAMREWLFAQSRR